jgi:hypothetical protein
MASAAAWRALRWLSWVPVAVLVNDRIVTVAPVSERALAGLQDAGGTHSRGARQEGEAARRRDEQDARKSWVLWRRPLFLERPFALGDVALVRSPRDPKVLAPQRVCARGNDAVRLGDGSLHKLRAAEVLFEGGAGEESFGVQPVALAEGRGVFVLWPPGRLGACPCRAAPEPPAPEAPRKSS